jgi:broad specificity phosphatase PhoE
MKDAITLLLLCLALAWPSNGFAQSGDATVVVLVRHAEKEAAGSDPALTTAGQARAELLASMLKDAGVTAIFATATRRTRSTAAPLAAQRHLDVVDTDKDLARVRAQVLAAGRRTLIVGHSNTLPGLIAALGGPSGLEIADNEFDAFFVLTIPPQGSPTLLTLRYGAPAAAFANPMGGAGAAPR